MRNASVIFVTLVLLLVCLSAQAQTLTIGTNLSSPPDDTDSDFDPIRTVIDLTTPASATGIVTSVRVHWSAANCPGALKIKFFRPSTKLTMIGERGPFTVTSKDFTITLSPPVPVMKGDVIGLTRLTTCGVPMVYSRESGQYATFSSDFVGPYTTGYNYIFGAKLAVGGTGIETEEILRGIVPVVGSVAGSGGSNFRTSLQLLNAQGSGSISGKLVFHPANASGTTSDPTIAYTLGAGEVRTFPDLGAAFGRPGIGSIDVMTTQTSPTPLIVTRVFNDAGAAGTAGLSEDYVDVKDSRVLNMGDTGYLVAPVELAKTRFNIGVRSLLAGATVSIVLRASNGAVLRTLTKTYRPNWFEQVDSTVFLGGVPLGDSQSISITVLTGSVIVYGATTDNVTNDPALQYATR